LILVDPHASISGYVETFHADLNCTVGHVNRTDVSNNPYNWEIEADVGDDGCSTGLTLIAEPQMKNDGARSLIQIGKVISKQCPGDSQTRIFVFFAQVDADAPPNRTTARLVTVYSFNSTVLVCTPKHTLQTALVTKDSAGALIDVVVQKTLDRFVTSPQDLWSAFGISLQAASPTFSQGPSKASHDEVHNNYAYDSFFAGILASWSRNPAEYLDPDILMQDLRRLYTATASQIVNRFLRANSTIIAPGSYKTTRPRVILRDIALRFTETGLVVLIVCACLVLIYSPCSLASSATVTLASLAMTMYGSSRLKSQLCGDGKLPLDHIRDSLLGQSFSYNGNSNLIRPQGPRATISASTTSATGVTTWWRPAAFSIYLKIALLALPLVIVACLEASYQISRKKYGLDDAPSNRYWHYAWTWVPASTMTLVSLLYSSLTWSVALLDPYSILRTKSVAGQSALCKVNLSKPSIHLIYQGLRLKRYALLVAGVSALLAPLLTIIVSDLIIVQSILRTEDVTIPLADHISSPAGQNYGTATWTQASLWAANLLYQGYSSYPRGTYQNFVFQSHFPLPQSC
jgi:hypothetical protein